MNTSFLTQNKVVMQDKKIQGNFTLFLQNAHSEPRIPDPDQDLLEMLHPDSYLKWRIHNSAQAVNNTNDVFRIRIFPFQGPKTLKFLAAPHGGGVGSGSVILSYDKLDRLKCLGYQYETLLPVTYRNQIPLVLVDSPPFLTISFCCNVQNY